MSSVKIRLDSESLKHINVFQKITKAGVKDCIIDDGHVLFVVNEGQAGLAIGKGGCNIRSVQRMIKKKVEVLEFNDDLNKFLINVFRPVGIDDVESMDGNGKNYIKVSFDFNNSSVNSKSFVKNKIKRTKDLLKKYFGVDGVRIG